MQKWTGTAQDTAGNAIAQATVTVFNASSTGLAAIYADNNGTALANPFTGNTDGTFAFYGQNSRYDLTATKAGYAFSTTLGRDQLLYDISTVTTPAVFSANVNDYTPTDATTGRGFLLGGILRLTSAGTVTVTGLAAGTAGQPMRVWNVGAFAITLAHQSASSAAANRFVCPSAVDLTLNGGENAYLDYDGVASRWRVSTTSVATVATATLGSGTANATTFLRGDRTWASASQNLVTFFESADQTITNATVLNVAHGLGAKPKLVQVSMKCVTAELGYSIGDEVAIVGVAVETNAGTSNATPAIYDATNVTIITPSAGIGVRNRSTGADAYAGITNANWKYVVRAWL